MNDASLFVAAALPWLRDANENVAREVFTRLDRLISSSHSRRELTMRPNTVKDANGSFISAAAEPLSRWDRRPPEKIFNDGFQPLITPMNIDDFRETGDTNLHLHRYINDQVRSIFVSTTRPVPRDARGGPVEIWTPPVLNGRYRYEIFAYGGVDIRATFERQREVMYTEQEEITFIGGIRPELIRSATQYDEKGRVIRVLRNPRFDTRFNGDYTPRASELPELTEPSISFSIPAGGQQAPEPGGEEARHGRGPVLGDDVDECNGNFTRYRRAQLGLPSVDFTGTFQDPAVSVKVVISTGDGRRPPISLQQLSSIVAKVTGGGRHMYSIEAVSWDEAAGRKLKLIGSNPFGLYHTWMSSSDCQKLYDYGSKSSMLLPWPASDTGLNGINQRINAMPGHLPSETRDSISWDTMSTYETYHTVSQPEAICGVRADEVAKTFGLPPAKPGEADYQWLYRCPPALVGPKANPLGKVFFGTKECMAHMLRFEHAIASLIGRRKGVEGILVTQNVKKKGHVVERLCGDGTRWEAALKDWMVEHQTPWLCFDLKLTWMVTRSPTYLPLNSTCDFDPFSRYCPLLIELKLDDAVLDKYLDTIPQAGSQSRKRN